MAQDGDHYYSRSGMPVYGITPKDAMRGQLLPSPSTFLDVIKDEGLDRGFAYQLKQAFLTSPRLPEETDANFVQRIINDLETDRNAAAQLGTQFHLFIESYYKTGGFADYDHLPAEYHTHGIMLAEWLNTHTDASNSVTEKVIVNEHAGFAGRIDLITQDPTTGEPLLIDFKTQRPSGSSLNKNGTPKFTFYHKWAFQLAAYRMGTEIPRSQCISLAISTHPKLPHITAKQWPGHAKSGTARMSIERAEHIAMSALALWKQRHWYDLSDATHPIMALTDEVA